jgi:iron(III) transport system ATP-binding protein
MEGRESSHVLVRPQDVILDSSGLPACVISSFFEGERYALRLELQDGQSLRSFSRQAVRPGDMVHVVLTSGWRL